MPRRLIALLFCANIAIADPGLGSVTIVPVTLPPLPLGVVSLPSGKALNLTVAPGAGAFRSLKDTSRRIWTISDRGPSLDCMVEPAPGDKLCPPGRRGRVFLLPGYSLSIYALDINDASARYAEMITLKGMSGRPLTGIGTSPRSAQDEAFFASDGRQLDSDPSGIEPGGLVRLSDGTFFVTDGYAPSILEVAPDGLVKRRLVPQSMFEVHRNADYPIEAVLPASLAERDAGRGFAAIALSPDETALYVALQSPKRDGSDTEPYSILKLDRLTGQVLAKIAYTLDQPAKTPLDGDASRPNPSRIVEMQALDDNHMLVLERHQAMGRIYRFNLTTNPSGDGNSAPKSLIFSTERAPNLLGRLTAMTLLSDREIAVMASDSALEGVRTQLFRLTFARPITN